jgi:hypothetical protein
MCRKIAEDAPSFTPAHFAAVLRSRLLHILFSVIRGHSFESSAPAAATAAVRALFSAAASTDPNWPSIAKKHSGTELTAVLVYGLLSQSRGGAQLRYDAAQTLMAVLTTPGDLAKAAPLIQPQLCRILKTSDLEAEVAACAALLAMACAERPVMQWRTARSGVLPRLQQLLRHPDPSVVLHVVRALLLVM